jgi:hypothetical protein
MSVFKNQFTRALNIYESDYAEIPYPQVVTTGETGTSGGVDLLYDETKDFLALNVAAGDIVFNTSTNTSATVIEVVDENTILLNATIFTDAVLDNYTIYAASAQTTIGNRGCFLFVGTAGILVVETIGGDTVTLQTVNSNTIVPIQVVKVLTGTTASRLVALW